MYKSVTDVKPTDDFKLVLRFDNAEQRTFDASSILSCGRFAELKNLEQFKKVHIAFDTVEWENGLDLDPEYLYAKSR